MAALPRPRSRSAEEQNVLSSARVFPELFCTDMKTFARFALVGLLPCTSILSSSAFAQGSLTPPGAPAATMRTLDQLDAKLDETNNKLGSTEAKADEINAKAEKRTAISSVPFVIDQPGSYYLSGNLQFTAESGHAITIAVNDVTLDLMGFTLSSTPAVTGDGIFLNAGVRNVAIRNGQIAGNTTFTYNGATWTPARGGFGNGIMAAPNLNRSEDCEFSYLRISGCRSNGLSASVYSRIQHVTAARNGGTGIEGLFATVVNCSADLNAGGGIDAYHGFVSHSTSRRNFGTGISASNVTHCVAEDNGGNGIIARTVSNSVAESNDGHGISASDGTVTHSLARASGNDGIHAPTGVVAFCKASASNRNGNGSVDIDATGATRTGNHPTP